VTVLAADAWTTSVDERRAEGKTPHTPREYWLQQNYPNPFNPSTTIRYALPQAGYVTLKVYNLLGEEIAALISGRQPAGEHEVRWNAASLPSGVYFYRLQAGGFTMTRKLLLVR
jgi:hypothetical protein